MRAVPKWTLLPSGCAPVVLAGGWTTAAVLEGSSYDAVRQTISVLAAYGAPGFWVMTGALLALGVCHLGTAWGLRAAAPAGRAALVGGGVTALVVTMVPTPTSGGALRHGSVAAVGFTLLALWPVLATRRDDRRAPWALRRRPAYAATLLMGLGALWFLVEANRQGAAGVAERVVTTLQSLWPLVVVVSCLRHQRAAARRAHTHGAARRTDPAR
ncbi:DUF998 domain-containing protein [Streptomyces sp. NPDC006339]|uniref:DUF998 domain-containing protein n=1 Tax=Streptomyces sp. NPDC006339 TaxID=3156755 RepID=UPI0033B90272